MVLCSTGKSESSRWTKDHQFFPDYQEVFKVFVHLLSLIFLKMASSLEHLSIIMTNKSASVWPSLLKVGHHRGLVHAPMGHVEMIAVDLRMVVAGFSHILKTTPITLYWINCYRFLQEASRFNLKRSAVTLLENVSVVTNMGEVLHLLASQQKLPGDHFFWEW